MKKGAFILLLMACLLVASFSAAAAYEPTNGDALVATYYATKTIEKEEVVPALGFENVAVMAERMEPTAATYTFCSVYDEFPYFTGIQVEQEVSGARPRFT